MPGPWSKIRGLLRAARGSRAVDRRLWRQIAELRQASEVLDLARRRTVFRPTEREAPAGRRLLVIAPHPDDEAIGPGGTLALAQRRGCKISVLFVTSEGFDGAAGRVAEGRASCAVRGYKTYFLPLAPGRIPTDPVTAAQLAAVIEERRPEIVFLPFFLDDHDDHRRVLELLVAAASHASAPWHFEVWAYQVYSAAPLTIVVDITSAVEGFRRGSEAFEFHGFLEGADKCGMKVICDDGGSEPHICQIKRFKIVFTDIDLGGAGLFSGYRWIVPIETLFQ